jgi:uncharacterized protein (TIGR00251 family)
MVDNLLRCRNDGVAINIHLTPSGSRSALVRIEKDQLGDARLKVSVTAIPEKGKANAALIGLLSKKLKLPKSAIRIIACEQSRQKTILFEGEADFLMTHIAARFKALDLALNI